ncbi:MAG: hypothetical protein ACT4O4_06155 [Nitrospiraceae bacterium]
MQTRIATMETFPAQSSLHRMPWVGGLTVLLLLAALPVRAAEAPVPWECSNYLGDARTRCLNTFIEFQRDRIGQLEGELRAQQGAVGRLEEQIARQASVTSELQKQLSDRPAAAMFSTPYHYGYVSPPGFGLGLYLGRPWIYGSPYSFHPYWGLRLHRPWGHRR